MICSNLALIKNSIVITELAKMLNASVYRRTDIIQKSFKQIFLRHTGCFNNTELCFNNLRMHKKLNVHFFLKSLFIFK